MDEETKKSYEQNEEVGVAQKIRIYFSEEKSKKIIIIIGFVGIALIFLSSFFGTDIPKETTKENTAIVTNDVSEYKQDLEQNLADIVATIDGAGTTNVMITMDSSTELVYAVDEKLNENNNLDESSSSTESAHITVRCSDGSEETVLLKEVQPKIRGVLVVCSGGGNSVVNQRVLDAVTKALNISSAKVCVTKLSQ